LIRDRRPPGARLDSQARRPAVPGRARDDGRALPPPRCSFVIFLGSGLAMALAYIVFKIRGQKGEGVGGACGRE
jgi:hypothetical protein